MGQLGNIHISASISLCLIRSLNFCIVAMRDESQVEKSDKLMDEPRQDQLANADGAPEWYP
jgi:hypothetical protein